jgi:hypothetical protein
LTRIKPGEGGPGMVKPGDPPRIRLALSAANAAKPSFPHLSCIKLTDAWLE